MPIEAYYNGTSADIFVYVNPRGDVLVEDFIDGLNDSDKKKVVRLIKEFGDRGYIHNRQKFRLEDSPIYALKSFQIRIPCFFLPNSQKRTLVLTHGFSKKTHDMPKSELKRAKDIFTEIVSPNDKQGTQ